MPLHRFPVRLWKQLQLKQGLCARLPAHFLRSLEDARTPAPVHYRPHGARFRVNPANGQRERVEDVPIPIYYPPESQQGLWGGEGWVVGYRYVNGDKVGAPGSGARSETRKGVRPVCSGEWEEGRSGVTRLLCSAVGC